MRKKIKMYTDQRPFTIIYNDCLKSDLFDNHYQIVIYVFLKMFADKNNQCYPSIKTLSKLSKIGITKVKITINELEEKHLISKEHRTRPDGSQSSNLYTLYDFKELWSTSNSEEAAAAIDEYEEKKMIEIIQARGYKVIKEEETVPDNTTVMEDEVVVTEETAIVTEETAKIVEDEETVVEESPIVTEEMVAEEETATTTKEPAVSENIEIKEKGLVLGSDQTSNTSTNQINVNSFCNKNNTTQNTESQPLERYTMEEIRKRYDYYIYMLYNPTKRDDINTIFNVLYDALNTTKETLRVNREDKPAMVVISRLLKLNMEDILYVIEQYRKQTDRIKNVKGYLLSMLYNAKEQYHLDIQNQVSHDMDQWYEQKAQEKMDELE